ncbi:hypothetical protein [Lentzea sp. NPDC059081]|uniref:hypothetical protein n=1 Tax=Lentzea sp. NPDC059081 TaxID=3346719 RepID=UPI0036785B90
MNGPPPGQSPGWPQQPHWHTPPAWEEPPLKSRLPLLIAVAVGVLVLGGVIALGARYLGVNADSGEDKRSDKLPALCGNVSEATLAKARTTNPNGLASRETKLSKGTRTTCSWNQTKGVDGSGLRTTDVSVTDEGKDAESAFSRSISMHMANLQGTPMRKPVDGLGDEAVAILVETKSSFTEMTVLVRKGELIVEIDHSGWDAGLLTNTRPDPAELEAAAKGVAEEMVGKL